MEESIKSRKKQFIKNVSSLIIGVSYEKKRVIYDKHSDDFSMFIYFGKYKSLIIEPSFTGKSNYYFGTMNELEIKKQMSDDKDIFISECNRFSCFMIKDLICHFGSNYNKYIKTYNF